jgi:VIT1/CCC1 family predicted Fe2+/Mn2+ transporter
MDAEERSQAIFGAFDGTVSIIGLVFGLAVHGFTSLAIVVAGVSAAVSATVSMGSGLYECQEGPWRRRLQLALVMSAATACGSIAPVFPFLLFPIAPAAIAAALIALLVAVWIGEQKGRGWQGYVFSVGVLVAAAGVSVGVAYAIPSSAGG